VASKATPYEKSKNSVCLLFCSKRTVLVSFDGILKALSLFNAGIHIAGSVPKLVNELIIDKARQSN
jgi:hypothetical protein